MTWAENMAELAGAVEDAFGAHSVDVQRRTPGSLNTTTLARAQTSSLVSGVACARSEIEMIDTGDGQFASGVEYTFDATRLGSAPPARGDLVIEGAAIRTVVSCVVDAAGAIYRVRCVNRAQTKGS